MASLTAAAATGATAVLTPAGGAKAVAPVREREMGKGAFFFPPSDSVMTDHVVSPAL